MASINPAGTPGGMVLFPLLLCFLSIPRTFCWTVPIATHGVRTCETPLAASKRAFDITVTDNVFSQDACVDLDELAFDHAQRGQDGSSIFDRTANRKQWTPMEHAMDSYLTSVGDPYPIVEYWSRNEYLNMDAHADIDEQELEEDETLRYPEWGHVLYMDVEDDVRGPTCVFDRYGGWSSAENTNADDDNGDEETTVTLVTVPAVQGRVLRFPGSAMHAVPKPNDRWLMGAAAEKLLRRTERNEANSVLALGASDDEDDDDDDDEEEEEDWEERSVLLFNTWDEKGPRGVSQDYITGILPDGISIVDGSDDGTAGKSTGDGEDERVQRQIAEWEDDYGPKCTELHCHDVSEWKQTPIVDPDRDSAGHGDATSEEDGNDGAIVRVSLMGVKKRRLHGSMYVKLESQTMGDERIRQALNEAILPTRIRLEYP